ncbi:hypothetical protein FACS1894190_15890 [Spirochaetia bacterium]|nr:hypothetical protein FACS1894190_15890 [Spirochaetia bacterium]
MAEKSNFERLSSSLTQEDKVKLLEKIKSNTDLSERSLIDENTAAPKSNNAVLYGELPWYKKLLYLIIGFFTGKSTMDTFVYSLFSEEGRSIELQYPGMYDFVQGILKQNMQEELKKLKDSARFFYSALDSSFNKDAGAFFVFLGSVEMPNIHRAIVEGTEPSDYAAKHPDLSYKKIKKLAVNYVETQLENITDEQRTVMYQSARSLLCLKQLSSFLFDRLILSFNPIAGEPGNVCPVGNVKNMLLTLNNILFSIKTTPSINLLSSMFVFFMQEHFDEDGFDEDIEMQKYMTRAEKSLDVIRTFNRHVPLTRIIRCIVRDLSYTPSELSGGESWFAQYRETWIENIAGLFDVFIRERRLEKIDKLFDELFNGYKMESFDGVHGEEDPDGIPVDGVYCINVLLIFHKIVFMPEINIILRPILIDGEFIKADNRTEFTECYNILIKLDDTIKNLMRKIAPGGEYQKRWEQIFLDVQSIPVRRRKTQVIQDEVSAASNKIIRDAHESLIAMKNILKGIIKPSDDGKHDALSNLEKIKGKGTFFMDGLNSGLGKLDNIVNLVSEIKALDAIE